MLSSLEKANKIENYYGFENGIDGKELYKKGIKQATLQGIELKDEEVINIQIKENIFIIKTNNHEYTSKAVVFATGNYRNKPKNINLEKYEGKGVSYCAICDGFFFKNKSVAVLGNGEYALSEVNDLINIVKDITILTNGEKEPEFRADNVKIINKKIKELQGDKKIERVQFIDGTTLETECVFIAQGVASSIDFARKLGVITNNETIVVNNNMETNISGLFACGDCTGGLFQISKSIYEGTIAGLQAIKYIKEIDGGK